MATNNKNTKVKNKGGRPKGIRKPKASAWEVDIRTDTAEELLILGYGRSTVIKSLMKEYSIGEDQGREYVNKAMKRMAEKSSVKLAEKRKTAVARRVICVRRSVMGTKPDLKAAHLHLEVLELLEGVAVDKKLLLENSGVVTVEHEVGKTLNDVLKEVMADPAKRKAMAKKIAPPRGKVDATPRSKSKRPKATRR